MVWIRFRSFQLHPVVSAERQVSVCASCLTSAADSHMYMPCKCNVSSQSIIGWFSPRQPSPTSPCSCIWGPTKQCLARWSHDPRGNTHDSILQLLLLHAEFHKSGSSPTIILISPRHNFYVRFLKHTLHCVTLFTIPCCCAANVIYCI